MTHIKIIEDVKGVHPCAPSTKVDGGLIGYDDKPPCINIGESVIIDHSECQNRCKGCHCIWHK